MHYAVHTNHNPNQTTGKYGSGYTPYKHTHSHVSEANYMAFFFFFIFSSAMYNATRFGHFRCYTVAGHGSCYTRYGCRTEMNTNETFFTCEARHKKVQLRHNSGNIRHYAALHTRTTLYDAPRSTLDVYYGIDLLL